EHRTPVPGLYLANMSQIYPQDRGQNYSILLGETIAETVAADLARAQAAHYAV
ncbi:MAG: amine oxidase, partial [Chloroflexi bacterium]|nr:amine oxidase [Chloroflexota bacterium]